MIDNQQQIVVKTDFLKKYMKQHGLSERTLAKRIGVSHSTVNRVLNGKRNPGNKFIAGLLSNFTDLSFDDVFSYHDPSGKEKEAC